MYLWVVHIKPGYESARDNVEIKEYRARRISEGEKMSSEDMKIFGIKVLWSSQKGDQMNQEGSRQEEEGSESRN